MPPTTHDPCTRACDAEPPAEPPHPPGRRRRTVRALVLPANLPPQEARRFLNKHCREAGELVTRMLRRRDDLGPESVEDVGQEVFIVLCTTLLRGETIKDVDGFLGQTAKNLTSNHVRSAGRKHKRAPEAELEVHLSPDADPETAVHTSSQMQALAGYVVRLPGREREAFQLVQIEQFTFDEAAEKLDRPRGTVIHEVRRAAEKVASMARAAGFVTEEEPSP
jgi:RNA polymerase sigma factor (sigma-70 family)